MFFQKALLRIKKVPLFLAVLVIAGLLNFYYVLSYGVDVPHRTEWDSLFMFSPQGSVFQQDQAGRPVLTHMISYIFYLLGGWNIKIHLLFNYFVYVADIVLLYRLIVKAAGEYRFLPLFFLPFFSDLNALNLMQATALQFHLTVLFGLIAADIGFCRPPTLKNSLRFILFGALSVLSMNIIFMLGLLIGWGIMEAGRKNIPRIIGMFLFMIMIFHICCGGLSFFTGDQIFRFAVILFSAVLTGLDTVTPLHLIFILPPAVALGWGFYQRRLWKDSNAMMLIAIILAVFFSAMNCDSETDPYFFIHNGAGIVLFAVPVVFTLLRLVKPAFVYLCCLSVIGYSASFSPRYFQLEFSARRQVLSCAREYYNKTGDGNCPFISENNSAAFLDLAKQLNLSFTRH